MDAGKEFVRRHALQHGVDRGEHDQRRLVIAATMLGKLGERADAPGDDLRIWRHAVVRHAVPGWEAQALHVRGKEGKRIVQRRQPLAVAGDMQDRLAGLAARDETRKRAEHRGVEALWHAAGDDRSTAKQPRDGQAFSCRCLGHSTVVSSFSCGPARPRGNSAGAASACRGRSCQAKFRRTGLRQFPGRGSRSGAPSGKFR